MRYFKNIPGNISLVNYCKWQIQKESIGSLLTIIGFAGLVQYFEEEKQDKHNQTKVRQQASRVREEIVMPEFHLYLSFIRSPLTVLADLNKQLQKKNQIVVHTTACKIPSLLNSFKSYILHNTSEDYCEANLKPMQQAVEACGG